jgi:hypothetical protein
VPAISHFRKFGYQAVGYVDPKSLPIHDNRNPNQVDKGRLGVFIGYVNETTKQWRLHAPDLGRTITVTTIDFLESKKGGDLDLRIRGARPQGTPSDPVDRIAVGRPKVTLKIVELPPKEKLNNFEIRIPVKRTNTAVTDKLTAVMDDAGATDKSTDKPADRSTYDDNATATATATATTVADTQTTKRPASNSQEGLDTRKLKRIRAFIARLTKVKRVSEMDALEMGYAAAILKDIDVKVDVPIPKSYCTAVNDAVYGPQWRDAIKEELKALGVTARGERISPQRELT